MSSTSKVTLTFCMVTLLLFFVLSDAARPAPASVSVNPVETQHKVIGGEDIDLEDECEGKEEEECLMRRTLAAHLDYIYTQKQNP